MLEEMDLISFSGICLEGLKENIKTMAKIVTYGEDFI
jgi:hypothetical protein